MNMKQQLITLTLIVGLSAICMSVAVATERGGYFGFAAGQTNSDFRAGDFDDGSITSSSVDDTDTGWKLYGGYRFRVSTVIDTALEYGFVDLGEAIFDGVSDGTGFFWFPGPVRADVEADGLYVAYVVGKAFGKWSLFGKFGLFKWDAELGIVDSGPAFSDDDDGTDAMYGAGGGYRVSDRVAVRAEWEVFTDVFDEDIRLLSLGVVISG